MTQESRLFVAMAPRSAEQQAGGLEKALAALDEAGLQVSGTAPKVARELSDAGSCCRLFEYAAEGPGRQHTVASACGNPAKDDDLHVNRENGGGMQYFANEAYWHLLNSH